MNCIQYEISFIILSLLWGVSAFFNIKKNKFFILLTLSSIFSIWLRSYRLYTSTCAQHINHILFNCDVLCAILCFIIFILISNKFRKHLLLTLFVMIYARVFFIYNSFHISWWLQTIGHFCILVISLNVNIYGHI